MEHVMNITKMMVVLLIAGLILVGCDSPKSPIRIGVNTWPPCEIWYVAQEMGFLGETRVELVRFSAWTDNMQSLYAGKTDLTHATYFNALYFADRGEPGEIILISDTIEGGDGLALKNDIATGADLKGRKIAVEVGTDEHFLLHKALGIFGLTIDDVIVVPTTSAGAKEAFVSGKVDACFTYEPYLSQAAEEGEGRVLVTTKDFPGYMIDVLVARSNTLKNRKSDYQTIVKAWYQAQKYIKENPEKSFALMAKNEKMPPEVFGPFYSGFTFFSLAENKALFKDEALQIKLDEINEFILSIGLKKKKATVADVINSELTADL
jgi:NitT/TauT family transport system substrate-binding protein